jgi:hypothetical protein
MTFHETPPSVDAYTLRSFRGGIIDMANETPPLPTPTFSLIDNPMAPDVFADEALGFFVHDGIVRITFAAGRWNHTSSPPVINRVVIGRLAMSTDAAQALAIGLFDFLKSRGLVQKSLPLGEGWQKPN